MTIPLPPPYHRGNSWARKQGNEPGLESRPYKGGGVGGGTVAVMQENGVEKFRYVVHWTVELSMFSCELRCGW